MTPAPILPIFLDSRAYLYTFDIPGQLTVEDILAEIAKKEPRAIGGWRELSREEYSRSFAVAQTAGYGIVRDIYEALLASFAGQETEVDFAARVMPLLRRKGWLGSEAKAATRLKLIYDTNLRMARATGRWARYQRTSAAFPYLRAVTARDERVRHPPRSTSDHRAYDGIILPVGHSFWKRYFPPVFFRCRCSVIQMTRSQLARWPGGITSEEEVQARIERLGEPDFQSAVSFDQQLSGVVAVANENRIPGQQALDMRTVVTAGDRLLQAQLLDEGIREISEVLNRVLGVAA